MHDGKKIAHIPKNHGQGWTWYAIEFGIVLAISMLLSEKLQILLWS